jgi:hypothetical protein
VVVGCGFDQRRALCSRKVMQLGAEVGWGLPLLTTGLELSVTSRTAPA